MPAREVTDEQWRRYFDVNVLSAVRLVRAHRPAAAVGLALAMLALSLGAAVLGLAVGSWMG